MIDGGAIKVTVTNTTANMLRQVRATDIRCRQ